MVTIIIAYAAGVPKILDTCLTALKRHRPGCLVDAIKIVTDASGYAEAFDALNSHPELPVSVTAYDIGFTQTGSEMHGKLLDMSIVDSNSEYILSLDSDCFPVADDWVKTLMKMQDEGATISGILWPWIPPPADLNEKTIEYKIRKYHCYNCTQVACQLVKRNFIIQNKLSFVSLRDTGFAITDKARELGLQVKGLMPTRCPMPEGDIDPEVNRMCSVIYGDMIYHHGAATRSVTVSSVDPQGFFNEARNRVLREKGAEWLLDDNNSYRYKFDKEEAVAQFKMASMFSMMQTYLTTHDRLFEPEGGLG